MDHLALLHPSLRPHIESIHTLLRAIGKRKNFEAIIAHSFRDPSIQAELYKKGREFKDGKWVVTDRAKVVTNAQGKDSAHCVTLNGKPASCAVDFALLRDGKYLPDKHHAWALIAALAATNAPEEVLECGAFWNSPRDWGHLELRNWRKYGDP